MKVPSVSPRAISVTPCALLRKFTKLLRTDGNSYGSCRQCEAIFDRRRRTPSRVDVIRGLWRAVYSPPPHFFWNDSHTKRTVMHWNLGKRQSQPCSDLWLTGHKQPASSSSWPAKNYLMVCLVQSQGFLRGRLSSFAVWLWPLWLKRGELPYTMCRQHNQVFGVVGVLRTFRRKTVTGLDVTWVASCPRRLRCPAHYLKQLLAVVINWPIY